MVQVHHHKMGIFKIITLECFLYNNYTLARSNFHIDTLPEQGSVQKEISPFWNV